MRNPFKPGTPAAFFWAHAGYSYDPKTQTPATGRRECAESLTRAESLASEAGYSFEWSIDPDTDSSSFRNGKPYALWQCFMRDPAGKIAGSLGGIDFGRHGEPWGDNYRRVIQAELSSEIDPADIAAECEG
jgi:hypothetical protein